MDQLFSSWWGKGCPQVTGTRESAFGRWTGTDPLAAAASLKALPESPREAVCHSRNAMRAGFIQKMVTTDAPGVLAMTLALPNEGQRQKLSGEVLIRWENSDPAGFAQAAEGI
jgi:hypothetical protein